MQTDTPQPTPDVTVVIPAWRAERGIRRAVGSALEQRRVALEVVVVDDCSPDRTGEIAREIAAADPRVRVLRRSANGGPGAARNLGFAEARGDWIAVLDADDAMAPGRLHRMMALARRCQADIVLGNLMQVFAPDQSRGSPFLPDDRPAAPLPVRDFVKGNLRASGGRTLGYLKPLISRAFVERSGLRYDETLRNGEDCHLILSAYVANARVWLDPAPEYVYLRRTGSLSARSDPAHLEALLAAERRMAPALEALPDRNLGPLLRARRHDLERVLTVERAMQALKSGRTMEAARGLAVHPTALPRMVRQLAEAARNRLAQAPSAQRARTRREMPEGTGP